jgi:6-phosphogluconolactonase
MPQTQRGQVRIAADLKSLFDQAAELIVGTAREAITRNGRFSLVLTGGSTPKGLYELLSSREWRDRIDWNKTHLFWGDERFVPATDSQSNYGMAKRALLDHLKLPAANIHRIVTENTTPEACANAYARDIENHFEVSPGLFPSFDLILNGLGSNRHTLSLFPGRPTVHEDTRLVVSDCIPEVSMDRVTMTAPLVNAGQIVVFLVSGKDKAEALQDVLYGAIDIDRKPAQAIKPNSGNLIWLVDKAAASRLPEH